MTSTLETGIESKDHKDNFGVRLEQILESPLSTDLNRHLDLILNELEKLLRDAVSRYRELVPEWETELVAYKAIKLELAKESGHPEPKDDILLEELACKFFKIPDVVNMLSSVLGQIEKLKQIDDFVGEFISSNTVQDTRTIVSPDSSSGKAISPGDKEMRIRKLHDRLKVICFVLISGGVELKPETVKITRGLPPEGSMRKEPYYLIEIPSLDRIVLECLEEGNKVFIFDSRKLPSQKVFELLEKQALDMGLLKSLSKEQLQAICDLSDGTGIDINHSARGAGWETRVSENLFGEIQNILTPISGRYQEQVKKILSRGVVPISLVEQVDLELVKDNGNSFMVDKKLGRWGTVKVCAAEARRNGVVFPNQNNLILQGVRVIIPDVVGARWSPILFNLEDLLEKNKREVPVFGELPLEEGRGEWEGFYVARDENGLELHFGSSEVVSNKIKQDFGVDYPASNVSAVVRNNIDVLRYVDSKNSAGTGPMIKLTAYKDLLEKAVIEDISFQKYLQLPVVKNEGVENAYLDVDGVRYGTLGYVIHAAGKPRFGDPITLSGLDAKVSVLLGDVGDKVEARSASGNKINGGLKRVEPLLIYLKWWNSLGAIFADKFTLSRGQRYATNKFYKEQIQKDFNKNIGMNNITNAANRLREKQAKALDCKISSGRIVKGGQFSYEQIIGELESVGVIES